MAKRHNPKRGEIWIVEFEPQVGSEIKKTRPAVVIGIAETGTQTTRLVVPIRDTKPHHKHVSFYVPIAPSGSNGLSKASTIDCVQVKSFDRKRFQKKIGKVTTDQMDEIAKLIALLVGYC